MRKNWDWYVTLKKKIALNFFKKEVKKKGESKGGLFNVATLETGTNISSELQSLAFGS